MNLSFPVLEESKQSYEQTSVPSLSRQEDVASLHWQYPEKIVIKLPKNARIVPLKGEVIFPESPMNVLTGKTLCGESVEENSDLQAMVRTAQKAMQACLGISSINFFSRPDGHLSLEQMKEFSSVHKANEFWHSTSGMYKKVTHEVSFQKCKTIEQVKSAAEVIKELKAGNCRHLCLVAAAKIHETDPTQSFKILESGNHVYMTLSRSGQEIVLDPWTRAIMPKGYKPSYLLGDVAIYPNTIQEKLNSEALFYPVVIDNKASSVREAFKYPSQDAC